MWGEGDIARPEPPPGEMQRKYPPLFWAQAPDSILVAPVLDSIDPWGLNRWDQGAAGMDGSGAV